jgi:ABC-type transport system substrate-binding protein
MRRTVGTRCLALVVAGTMFLVACGGDDSGGGSGSASEGGGAAGSPGSAGELVVATSDTATMDPARLQTESSAEWDRAAAVFDTLLRWTADDGVAPQLAESMESPDGQVWTLTLRPDLTFTDGTPLDADAVIFNIERQRDPANACGCAGNLAEIESMRAVDPVTVEITLSRPNGSFDEGFTGINGMIGSPTAIEADPEGFGSNPVGAGPYALDEWVRDDHLTLQRNPDYWDPDKPAYETVELRFMADPIARAAAVTAGEVDVAYAGGPAMLIQLGDVEPLGYRVERTGGASFVLMNHSRGPTQDVRVREAISLAFDPERVNSAVLGGLWESQELTCPPFEEDDPECNPGLWPTYDPDRARDLIDEYAAEGNSTELRLIGNQSIQGELEFLQQTLNDIGLDVSVNPLPVAEWLPAVNAGEFDLSWYAIGQPIKARMFYLFRSDQRNLPKAQVDAYDEAVLTARTAIDDDESLEAWRQTQQAITDDFLVAWYAPFIDGYVVRDAIDYGDQIRSVRLQLSELAPAE